MNPRKKNFEAIFESTPRGNSGRTSGEILAWTFGGTTKDTDEGFFVGAVWEITEITTIEIYKSTPAENSTADFSEVLPKKLLRKSKEWLENFSMKLF